MADGTLSLGRVDAFGTCVASAKVALAVVDECSVGLVGLAERAHLGAAADHRSNGQSVLRFGLRHNCGAADVRLLRLARSVNAVPIVKG